MNDRARELLERGLEKDRNKYISRKKRDNILKMNHWQKDTDTSWILRDYKTFLLYIVKNKEGKFQCSFSGAKMSLYSCNSDTYSSLKEAKIALELFIDKYDSEINPVVSE